MTVLNIVQIAAGRSSTIKQHPQCMQNMKTSQYRDGCLHSLQNKGYIVTKSFSGATSWNIPIRNNFLFWWLISILQILGFVSIKESYRVII
ncbi:hypothetical protein CFR74_10740 [Novacetimonas hansenii]|nr:hypothetical protein CFR74_10740 [Novacetimonas hansenii]RFP04462.1 hypothetical protein BGC30_05400 [Novacetimonas hansenii]